MRDYFSELYKIASNHLLGFIDHP